MFEKIKCEIISALEDNANTFATICILFRTIIGTSTSLSFFLLNRVQIYMFKY
jgi:hypothetical protein